MNIRNEFRKPEWFADWKTFILFALVSFVVAFMMRAMELPKWSDPAFMVDGEYIMGTHDAYAWLAGAKGVGKSATNPMSTMVGTLGAITGAPLGNIAFWLPAVFAGFTAVAAFAWGVLVAGPWGGLVAAVCTTGIPGYFLRTRISYYDTDIITLLLPLFISVCLARWVVQGIRGSWLPSKTNVSVKSFIPTAWDYLLLVLAGFLASYGALWHADVLTFAALIVLVALGLVIVCGYKDAKDVLIRGLVLFSFAALYGLFGVFLSLACLIVFYNVNRQQQSWYKNVYLWLGLLLVIFFASPTGQNLFYVLYWKVNAYIKPSQDVAAVWGGINYPGIAQSVIEAQNININALFLNLAGSPAVAWIGFIGFLFALASRPALFLLFPFVIITIAAMKMGGRFTMFGGIWLGIGLFYPIYFIAKRFIKEISKKKVVEAVGALVVSSVFLVGVMKIYMNYPPTPVLKNYHVKALIDSGKKMSNDATVWTWWDWGYASMYYTGKNSFADGGRHGGALLYPLAFAYATPYPTQANQMVLFSAENKGNPADVWAKMKANDVQDMIRAFGAKKIKAPKTGKQYFVLSWENFRLAYWILYYGSWNIVQGGGMHPNCVPLHNTFRLDPGTGLVTVDKQGQYKISGLYLLSSTGAQVQHFPNNVGPTLVYNQDQEQAYFIDEFMRNSLMVRMLLDSPNASDIAANFKLVYEDYPNVRVYEVL